MKNFATRAGTVAVVCAAAMSILTALFFPYGYPWPTVAWAILACAVLAAMALKSLPQEPTVFDVIQKVEIEPAQVRR